MSLESPVERSRALWILGLNHAGTTIVWRMLRKDPSFLCFDEPLTPSVGWYFPENNPKRTFDEYIDVYGDNPRDFWSIYEPIYPLQELNGSLSARQKDYLRALLSTSSEVVIDETHMHLCLPDLEEISPGAYVIHLVRSARGFVTSHLRPRIAKSPFSARKILRGLRHEYDKRTFWSRRDFPPGMARDEVIGSHPKSKFGLMLAEAGYDADRIMRSTSLVRLLAYWHFLYHHIETNGPLLFGERFKTVSYDRFASDTPVVMAGVYAWLGKPLPPRQDYSGVHPPKPAFCADDRRWVEAARTAGFSDEECKTLL